MRMLCFILSMFLFSLYACNKIEYCLFDKQDNFIKFKADKTSKCYFVNVESRTSDYTENPDASYTGYVTLIQFFDYSKHQQTLNNEDGFGIVLSEKK